MTCKPRHLGFTFVELFAAVVICAILMIAVTGVIGAIGTPASPSVEASDTPTFSVLNLAGEQLEWDLANARYFKFDHNILTLRGYGSLDQQTLTVSHRPTEIKYMFEAAGESGWLVRQQRHFDSIADDTTTRQLLLTGLGQILIQVLEQPLPVDLDETSGESTDPRIVPEDEDMRLDDQSTQLTDEEVGDEQPDNDETIASDDTTDETLPKDEEEPLEIEWLDLKQSNQWFLVPGVVKFVFIPAEGDLTELTYNGYDLTTDDEEPDYPQKVVILR